MPVPPAAPSKARAATPAPATGDCHLLVIHDTQKKLYEMWRHQHHRRHFYGGCATVWDLTKRLRAARPRRGLHQRRRRRLPDDGAPVRRRRGGGGRHQPRHPLHLPTIASARAATCTRPRLDQRLGLDDGPNSPPYGARLRLRADYAVANLPSAGARVVARALQKYGMFLSDGGSIALTATSDRFHHAQVERPPRPLDLQALKVTDFVMVDGGARIPTTGSIDCVRQ